MLSGHYGTDGKTVQSGGSEEVHRRCRGDHLPSGRPDPERAWRLWRARWSSTSEQDEDVLTYALFPQVATDFFKYREAQQKKVDPTVADDKE